MIVDVVDCGDPIVGFYVRKGLREQGVSSTVLEMYAMSDGVGQMVFDLLGAVRPGQLDLLRIWAHGGPGRIGISNGWAGGHLVGPHLSGLSSESLDSVRSRLARLRPLFARGARVELRGCAVAANDAGGRLLSGLSGIWGICVQAGAVNQRAGREWLPPVYQSLAGGPLQSASIESLRNR